MIEQLDKNELLALLHKRCTTCGVVKYFGEFGKGSSGAGGVTSRCKVCAAEYNRKYREKNKEALADSRRKYCEENKGALAEYQRKYREENREAIAELRRKWNEENKERVTEYGRKYREKNKEALADNRRKYCEENKEKRAEYNRKYREKSKGKRAEYDRKRYQENREKEVERVRKWQKENPEKKAEYNSKRRARRVNAAGSHTAEQVKARFDYYGNKCIYCGSDENLQIEHRIPLARGGSDWAANLAPACKSCNCSKGTKTETEFKEFLENKTKKTI
jgi:5-methylcytosine-specific restriction endonuclease McrA